MELNDIQQRAEEVINKIDIKNGCRQDNETTLTHIFEEIGELSRQIVNPKLNRGNTDIENLSEEIADIILLIAKLANNNNINIEDSIKKKLAKLNQRHNL